MEEKKEFLKINFRKRSASGVFVIFDLDDHGHKIAYLPSFNLSGYGQTKEEAHDMLINEVLVDFLENLTALPEYLAMEELTKFGWKRNKILKKQFTKPAFVDKEGVLKNFNLSETTVIQENLIEVNE
ncbi:hypothetical protein RCC89_04240 [Cytophagaceae bacterium ABcell3]|nr:hypothetical protein RCC89_04240 [Cytophagaceae bacterium ABcell3]